MKLEQCFGYFEFIEGIKVCHPPKKIIPTVVRNCISSTCYSSKMMTMKLPKKKKIKIYRP